MSGRKIGILGLGSIGSRHLANFNKLGCEMVGFDPALSLNTSLEDIFACDAVVVASPTKNHFEHIYQLHKRKIPTFVEKPIVATRWEWDTVPTSYVRMVGYNLRFHSCVKKARYWMGDGLIGKPLWARFTCAQHNEKEVYLRDGVLLNWSHEIDLALHLLGSAEIVACAAVRHTQFEEDLADITLSHKNGCQSVIHLDYLTKPERRGFTIVGDGGSIDCDLVSRQTHMKNLEGRIINSFFGSDSFEENYVSEAQTFLDHLDSKLKPQMTIGCTAAEGMAAADICLDAKEHIRGV